MLIVLTDADSLPVSAEQMIAHCRAPEDGTDDDLLEAYQRAAVAYVEKHCGIVLQPKEMQYRINCWPAADFEIPATPVRDVSKVEYLDENGILQEIDEANWTWTRTAEGARITFKSDYSLPELIEDQRDRVRVTFTAGFDDPSATGSGDDPAYTIPRQADVLIKMLTSYWYEQREPVTKDGGFKLPLAAEAILAQLRVYR